MGVQGHEVIIAATRAEVTPGHNFVSRVVGASADSTRFDKLGRSPCRAALAWHR